MSATDVEAPETAAGAPAGSSAPALQRVTGPTAVGGSWRRFLHLTWLIASTDYKLTYFGSALGYIWSFAQPLLFFGVLYVVFALLVGQSVASAKDFPMVLLLNIVLFSFFQTATGGAVASVVQRENLVRKMHFPRLVIPLSVVTTCGLQLMLNLAVVLVFMVIYGVEPRLTWLCLPIVVAGFAVLSTGLAMLLSALYVRYRDVAPIWSVVSQALFYASGIFITIETIVKNAGHGVIRAYLSNPLAVLLQQARDWMIGGTHSAAYFMGSSLWLLVPGGLTVGICVLGYVVFSRMAPRIAEEL